MKISFTILIFFIIIFNQLSVVDLYQYYVQSHVAHLINDLTNCPQQEEDSTQKEIKENEVDQEWYYARNYFIQQMSSNLIEQKNYIIFNASLDNHPFYKDIQQPPEFI